MSGSFQISYFSNLPNEVLFICVNYFDVADQENLFKTAKGFRERCWHQLKELQKWRSELPVQIRHRPEYSEGYEWRMRTRSRIHRYSYVDFVNKIYKPSRHDRLIFYFTTVLEFGRDSEYIITRYKRPGAEKVTDATIDDQRDGSNVAWKVHKHHLSQTPNVKNITLNCSSILASAFGSKVQASGSSARSADDV